MNTDTSNLTPCEPGLPAHDEKISAAPALKTPALRVERSVMPPPLPTLATLCERTEDPEEESIIDKTVLYPRILRWIGAGILGVAAICFMVSGWVQGSPLVRTGSFLGFTALLSGAGIFCAYRWREDKGARTFLALATAFLPANFAQLGAMIYAEVHGSTGYQVGLKKIFTFAAVDQTTLILTTLGSLAVLIPIAYTGFSALARSGAKKMTALFVAGNALLLLPWREANLVALLGVGAVTMLVFADRKRFAKETALRTWDGVAMRTLLFVPVGLLLARNLIMHDITYGILAFIFGTMALFFHSGLPRCLPGMKSRIMSQFVGYLFGWGAWASTLLVIFPYDTWGDLWEGSHLALLILPWCLGVFALSFKSEGKGIVARGLTSAIAFAVCWANLEFCGADGYLPNTIALLVAIGLLLAAFLLEEKAVLINSIAMLLVALGYHIHFAVELIQGHLWISLALAGMSVILAASYLERNGIGLRQRAQGLRKHWKGWN